MINFVRGDITRSNSEAIVNTVNLRGVMGKGIALAFKIAFPENFKLYKAACLSGDIAIGKLFVTETGIDQPKYIINFPTKDHWRFPSKMEFIDSGLKDLKRIVAELGIKSISIPPLGAGNGKLEWSEVKQRILETFSTTDIEVNVFEPDSTMQSIIEQSNKPRKIVRLTNTRALMLHVMSAYRILGNEINLLVVQKLAYFLQRFGENLNLKFEKGFYGPYSDPLNHFLKYQSLLY